MARNGFLRERSKNSRTRKAHTLKMESLEAKQLLSCSPAMQLDLSAAANVHQSTLQAETTFDSQALVRLPSSGDVGKLDGEVAIRGTTGFIDRVDRFHFQVDESGKLNAELKFQYKVPNALLLFNENGQLVGKAFSSSNTSAEFDVDLEPGRYTAIVLRGFGSYLLSLDFSSHVETPAPEPVQSPTPVTQPSIGVPGPAEILPSTPEAPPVSPPATELASAPWYGSSYDWNLNSVNAPEAWQAGYTGQGVVVAVIDTGVNVHHPDLNDNVWTNTNEIAGDGIDNDGNGFVDDYYGWNFAANSPDILDDNGHGTHVAGTIAAERNGAGVTGVAPDAEIMSIKALNANGSGSSNLIANGIRYAVQNGAHIINLSLGGGFSSAIASAISYAASHDVFVVAASGNESAAVPGNPATLSNRYQNLVSVGAYNNENQIASFSNRVGNSGAIQVDAPGQHILSTSSSGRYTYLSGTSMATPHVAGVAALTLSASPNLSAANLRNVIVTSANQTVQGSDARGAVNTARAIPLAMKQQGTQAAPSGQAATLSSTIPGGTGVPVVQNAISSDASTLSSLIQASNGIQLLSIDSLVNKSTGSVIDSIETENRPSEFDQSIAAANEKLSGATPLQDSAMADFQTADSLFNSGIGTSVTDDFAALIDTSWICWS